MRTPEGLLRSLWPLWLCTVTVWLIARNTVAKSPCKCGCVGGIYIIARNTVAKSPCKCGCVGGIYIM